MNKRVTKSPSIKRAKSSPIRTFTYFVPAPPRRKTGYQEKEFDRILFYILQNGFELISLHTSTISSSLGSGMWVICTLKAKTKNAEKFDLEVTQEQVLQNYQGTIPLDPMIEHD